MGNTSPEHGQQEKGVVLELLDDEADVLYVSFERPQGATDSELTDDGVLTRYRGDQLVGVTILNVRKRFGSIHPRNA